MNKGLYCRLAVVIVVGWGCKNSEGAQAAQVKGSALSAKLETKPISSDYAIYTIACVAGGKFIEVAGEISRNEKFNDRAKIQQYSASVSNGIVDGCQRWHIIYKTTVNNIKYYQIRNVFSGKLLDVPGSSSAPGTQLQQYFEFPVLSDEQLWKIQNIGTTGKYNIINKGSGLAVTNHGSTASNGTSITEEALGTGDHQKWTLSAQTLDTYRDDNVVRFFNRNGTSQGSVAFDEGTSIPLTWGSNNGKVLWITQDAWDGASLQANGKFNCGSYFSYGNSILIQPSATNWDNTATPNMTRNGSAQNKPKQIIDIQPNNTFAWPGPGVEIGSHVYIQVGEGSGLTGSNQSLYDLTESTGTLWTATRTTPAGMSGQAVISYAAGMVKSGNYVYVFGTQGTGHGYNCNVHVARFLTSNPQSGLFGMVQTGQVPQQQAPLPVLHRNLLHLPFLTLMESMY